MGNVDITRVTNAERAVLGCAMAGDIGRAVLLQLGDEDFFDPQHQILASIMRDMVRRNVPPDMITIQAELAARGKSNVPKGVSGVYLHDLWTFAPNSDAAPFYAREVRANSRVRLANEAGQRLTQMTCSDDSAEELDAALARHSDEMSAIPAPFDMDAVTSHTLEDLLNEEDEEHSWLIPGLLARGERVVMTGPEGLGKSTITRQISACVAAGIHPFTGERVSRDGFRVLHIDTENDRRQSRRNYRWISAGMPRNIADGWLARVDLYPRTEGVNLAGRDRAWFHQVAAACSPDLIVLAPAYKVMIGLDPDKANDVFSLLNAIDEVRTRHDAAVVIEAHSGNETQTGKRPVRPFGSSVWMRWPEVGFGFRVDEEAEKNVIAFDGSQRRRPRYLKLVSFRGDREDRYWPGGITWGPDGGLPWVPSHTYHPLGRAA